MLGDATGTIDRSYVIDHAQMSFDMENVPTIVEDLYLKLTKQNQYSEVNNIEEFVHELPELMR